MLFFLNRVFNTLNNELEVVKLADVLGCTVNELLREKEETT